MEETTFSDGTILSLQLGGLLKTSFIILYKNSNHNKGIPCGKYKEVRKAAQELAAKHPNWPKDTIPNDAVQWNGNIGEFSIKPGIQK